MFRSRRDVTSKLLLSLLFLLIILILSQILVVHNGRLGNDHHNMRKLQVELRELDINLHSVMMHRVPSIELNRRLLQNQINSKKFLRILKEASKTRLEMNAEAEVVSDRTESDNNSKFIIDSNSVKNTSSALSFLRVFPSEEQQQRHHSQLNKPSEEKWFPYNRSSLPITRTHDRFYLKEPRSGGITTEGELTIQHDTSTSLANHGSSSKLSETNSEQELISSSSLGTRVTTGRNSMWPLIKHTPSSSDSLPAKRFNQSLINSPTGGYHQYRKTSAQFCPSVPPDLKGPLSIDLSKALTKTLAQVAGENQEVERGGRWKPRSCAARHKVAIVIPYRDRRHHLMALLHYLHPMLQAQQLNYRVFVVEQKGNDTFNKAQLMNVAFVEASKLCSFQCVVFHDVDLVPENDRNMYSCPQQPRHTSVAIDEMDYKLAYHELVGGVLNMKREHFQRVNGYSNLYWGWGAEDDDMAYRIMQVGLRIMRPPESIARYKTIRHTKRKPSDWRKRTKLLITGPKRYQFDGLNSLKYQLVHIKEEALYTHILVDLGKPPKSFS